MFSTKKTIVILLLVISFQNVTFANPKIIIDTTETSANQKTFSNTIVNPLAIYSTEWSKEIYNNCNTAANSNYLSPEEKNLIWILNMLRQNPQLFLTSVLLNPLCDLFVKKENRNNYYNSLISTLQQLKPVKIQLSSDSLNYLSAKCHAVYSGLNGYVGHERTRSGCNAHFYGECCDYGSSNALNILLDLLIDDGIPNFGHRKICLSPDYLTIGVSIQPHTTYRFNAVIDFGY